MRNAQSKDLHCGMLCHALAERLGDLSFIGRVSGFGDQGTENWIGNLAIDIQR